MRGGASRRRTRLVWCRAAASSAPAARESFAHDVCRVVIKAQDMPRSPMVRPDGDNVIVMP
eukprot:764495-Hanusia_phi.AAC.2